MEELKPFLKMQHSPVASGQLPIVTESNLATAFFPAAQLVIWKHAPNSSAKAIKQRRDTKLIYEKSILLGFVCFNTSATKTRRIELTTKVDD